MKTSQNFDFFFSMELRKSRLDKPVIGEPSYDGSLLNIDKETGRGVFIFPDGKTRLEGAWDTDTGMMIRAKEDGQNEVQMFLEKQFPGPNALVPCPYESQYVFVAKSSAMNGGEGLFAKKHLPAVSLFLFWFVFLFLHAFQEFSRILLCWSRGVFWLVVFSWFSFLSC